MRRPGPRHFGPALGAAADAARPATLLAAVQGAWPEAVGSALAAEAQPVSERAGTVTVACSSSAWAHELELLGGELLERLNARLPGGAEAKRLRFVTGTRRRQP